MKYISSYYFFFIIFMINAIVLGLLRATQDLKAGKGNTSREKKRKVIKKNQDT